MVGGEGKGGEVGGRGGRGRKGVGESVKEGVRGRQKEGEEEKVGKKISKRVLCDCKESLVKIISIVL